MIKNCVVLNGIVINIGDWDYRYFTDDTGNEIAGNPLPEGAVIEERDFEYSENRGWYEVGTNAKPSPEERISALETLVLQLGGVI